MDASIVVPTYNKRPCLEQTLRSLVNQKDAPRFEVIVVDDCSGDDTPELFETLQTDYPLRYLRNPVNMGRSKTRNVGLAACQGEVVIFLDDDRMACEDFVYQHVRSGGPDKIVLGKRWEAIEDDDEGRFVRQFIPVDPADAMFRSHTTVLRNVTARLLDPDADALTVRSKAEMRWDKEGNCYRVDGSLGHISFFHLPTRADAPLAWLLVATGNLSVWREDVLAAGGFDDTFYGWGMEDLELGYRMSLAKATLVFQPEAENFHLKHPVSLSKFVEMYDNWRYFYDKHPGQDAGLLILYVLRQISLINYHSKVASNPRAVTMLYSNADLEALRGMCATIDCIYRGQDVVLSLSPDVVLLDKGLEALVLLRPAFNCQAQSTALLCLDQAKQFVLRFDGRSSLSHIVQTFQERQQYATMDDAEAEFRSAAALLVRKGILCLPRSC